MKKFITQIGMLLLVTQFSLAQSYCGTDKMFHDLEIPVEQYESYQRKLKMMTLNESLMNRNDIYIIPVVFHIIHKGGIENISDDQIHDQMRIINEDFRKLSSKVDDIIPDFQAIAADCKIEFRLAKIDPEGNCTSGIARYFDEGAYATDAHVADSLKIGRQWPREKYLNIYVLGSIETSGGGTTLGFAYYPITVDDEKQVFDGIMQVYSSVGSFGTSSDRYSGVLTHEIGHYFHLHHTWGQNNANVDSACDEDDDVEDTPNTRGNPSVCNLSKESCGSLDNVQNFMDYSFCYAMLTEGQRVRMTAVLNDTIADRDKLWQTSNLIATGASDEVLGELCSIGFDVENDNNCIGDTFRLYDKSFHYVQNRYWNASGSPTYVNQDSSVLGVVYSVSGVYDVSLSVSNDLDSLHLRKNALLYVHSNPGLLPATYSQDFNNINSLNELIWDGNTDGSVGFSKSNIGKLDTGAVIINNYEAGNGQSHELETTTFNLTGEEDLQLVFDIAFAPKKTPCQDKLTVYISNDCGESWVEIQSYVYWKMSTSSRVASEPFVPNDTQWKTFIIDLTTINFSETTRFKFGYYSFNGNNFYLDNFKLQVNPSASILENVTGNAIWKYENNQWVNHNSHSLTKVALYDMQGRMIVSSNQNAINHAQLNAGIYIIRWMDDGVVKQQKVIKH
jgi:hypothetical protein